MGCPPAYGYLLFADGGWATRQDRVGSYWRESQAMPTGAMQDSCLADWKQMKEDIARIEAMPAEARDTIAHFWKVRELGNANPDGPCCWLDPETKECRWYEYRPAVCRGLPVGGEDCRRWRKSLSGTRDAARSEAGDRGPNNRT
jgi:Fe-S-cluster containining protein